MFSFTPIVLLKPISGIVVESLHIDVMEGQNQTRHYAFQLIVTQLKGFVKLTELHSLLTDLSTIFS